MKKPLLALLGIAVLATLGLALWARSVFTHDNVRTTLAAELAEALGQPVTVGSIDAHLFPRLTVSLRDVAIGQPPGVQIASIDVGTDLRALLSRRIEHASVRVDGAKIQLPLIPLGSPPRQGGSPPPDPSPAEPRGTPPVEIVSIDEIVLTGVEITSKDRTLRGDIEAVPEADGSVTLRRVSLVAGEATFEATGRLTDLRGPVGELSVTAGDLHFDQLIAFFSEFAGDATASAGTDRPARSRTADVPADLTLSIEATRATMAGVTLDAVSARAHITDTALLLRPLTFGLFGGSYDGAIDIRGGQAFTFAAKISGVDIAALQAFAGSAPAITGRLSGQLELRGTGSDPAAALKSGLGTARFAVSDGIVKNLGLVRAIVTATSMRGGASSVGGAASTAAAAAATSRDEAFSRLSATLAISGTSAATSDLLLEGKDVTLQANGAMELDGSSMMLEGRAQLSKELTAQAGTDLVRYTREDGRVTLPAKVTGSINDLQVSIDVAEAAKRAIRNVAEDQLKKAITKGLGGLLKKKPPRP